MDILNNLTDNPELLAENIYGSLAFVLTCLALVLLRVKNGNGWLVFIPSYLIQMIIFWNTKQYFLFFQMIVLAFFSIINYLKWEAKDGSSKF
jgi:nicotinamide riboside transporter PnuC